MSKQPTPKEIRHKQHASMFRILEAVIAHAENPGSLEDEIDDLARSLAGMVPVTAAEDAIVFEKYINGNGSRPEHYKTKISELKEILSASNLGDMIEGAIAELTRLRTIAAEYEALRAAVVELERKAEKDSIYRRAMENMAKQFVCPRMTAEELAMAQLKDRPNA